MKLFTAFAPLLLAAAAIVTTATASQAVPIGSLFNTGVDSAGVVLANLAGESHYTLTSAPPGSPATLRVATQANGFPIPPWIGDNGVSAWVGPSGSIDLTGPIGLYTYRTTFDLTGLVASTASISGQWSVDNQGFDILLNGVSNGSTATGFQSFYAFSLLSGFVDGVNTLDFVVENQGGPTGLRVEATGSADRTPSLAVVAVPEPVSLAILGSGLLAVGMLRRKQG